MADQEVIKHSKKVYKIWNSKEHNLLHKIKEFVVEILIIVFAVSLSIWLHERSEHNHQQKEVKEFLNGVKEDLQNDIKEMTADRKSFVDQMIAFKYITSIELGQSLHIDSLKKHQPLGLSLVRLQQNNGRFEGFKSSGKIGLIEDKILQNDIMDLYQEDIPILLSSTDNYNERKKDLFSYIMKNSKRLSDSTTNITTILATDEAQNICRTLSVTIEITDRYKICIDKMRKIISRIEMNNND
jgi:hypothetical protein